MTVAAEVVVYRALHDLAHYGQPVDAGHWQGIATEGRPDLMTKEIMNLQLAMRIPEDARLAGYQVLPNLPWAENHFQERVGRDPTNPGEEYKNWPWWKGQDLAFEQGVHDSTIYKVFSHTYQERFWPKQAGDPFVGDVDMAAESKVNRGLRYEYGDLDDVVALLRREPNTRQATFPIFFPEDTGAVHGGRVPCTLHYHFLLRNGRLNMWYPIRSCDAVRHFRDDVYMAMRLNQWVLEELRNGDNDYDAQQLWEDTVPGMLYFTAYSFHVHMGDYHLLEDQL